MSSFTVQNNNNSNNNSTQDPIDNTNNVEEDQSEDSAVKSFTFRELATATKNFRNECLLGEGGFGRVFKATLASSGKVTIIYHIYIWTKSSERFSVSFLISIFYADLVVVFCFRIGCCC